MQKKNQNFKKKKKKKNQKKKFWKNFFFFLKIAGKFIPARGRKIQTTQLHALWKEFVAGYQSYLNLLTVSKSESSFFSSKIRIKSGFKCLHFSITEVIISDFFFFCWTFLKTLTFCIRKEKTQAGSVLRQLEFVSHVWARSDPGPPWASERAQPVSLAHRVFFSRICPIFVSLVL